MTTRRMLIGIGAGPFKALATAFEILAPPIGAWPSWTHAFYNAVSGSSLFGAIASTGSVRVGEYAAGSGSSHQISLLDETDQHDAPAIIRRSSDGRYVAVWTRHAIGPMYVTVSTNPDDNSAWPAGWQIEDELGGGNYTYPFLCQLGDETSDPIYLFCRENTDSDNEWAYSKSTSGGADGSWAPPLTRIVKGFNYYARFVKTSESRIDMAVTSGSAFSDHASVYHGYLEGGVWHQSDGTVMGSGPFAITDFTLVYDGSSEGARIPNSIQKIGSRIVIACPTFTGTGSTGDYRIHDWDGSAWTTSNLATDVGMAAVAFGEGGLAIDPSDLDHAAASIKVGGTWRMHDCRRASAGAAWVNRQITFSGDEDRYPWFVIDHQPGLQYIWQKGTFTTEDIFDVGVWGYGTAA